MSVVDGELWTVLPQPTQFLQPKIFEKVTKCEKILPNLKCPLLIEKIIKIYFKLHYNTKVKYLHFIVK